VNTAKVFYKGQFAKIIMPIPPQYTESIYMVHPAMTLNEISTLMKAEQGDIDVSFTNVENGE